MTSTFSSSKKCKGIIKYIFSQDTHTHTQFEKLSNYIKLSGFNASEKLMQKLQIIGSTISQTAENRKFQTNERTNEFEITISI